VILYPPLLQRGITICPSLILIPKLAEDSRPYLAHEACHALQMRKVGTFTFWWRYLTHQPSRLAMEIEAYKAQVAAGGDLYHCAVNLANGYRIGLTVQAALDLITKPGTYK